MTQPPPTGRLVLGTRGSDLALAQATMTEAALAAACPGLEVRRQVIKTVGDKRPDLRFSEFSSGSDPIVDKGIFTKELEIALEQGTIDFAVHSLKDVPTELGDGFEITAVLPRAATEDVLLSRHQGGLDGLPEGATVATSSVRREALLGRLRPDLRIVEIRGNVPTRIGKLQGEGAPDAIVLARAGLVRLGFLPAGAVAGTVEHGGASVDATLLDPATFLPAAGQGAVGIETFRASASVRAALAAINDTPTFVRVRAERHFLHLLEAGCQTPVGAHTELGSDGNLRFRAAVFTETDLGIPPREVEAVGRADDPEAVAAAAFAQLA